MKKDLTNSRIDRHNILNNPYAVEKIQDDLGFKGYFWENQFWYTKNCVAKLFNVDIRTIENHLSTHGDELKHNGYIILKGAKLKDFKDSFGTEINFGTKTTILGIFSFRAVLNLAMLLSDSDIAKEIRSRILDISIDIFAEKTGGKTKYINQRDSDFLTSAYREDNERKKFTNALNNFVDMGPYKYALFTNKIYQSIFKENAKEYRQILNLQSKDKTRDTMYSEVLNVIASFEAGLAHEIEVASNRKGRLLSKDEVEEIFNIYESHPLYKPFIEDARTKMASRDLCFREAVHYKLENYISTVDKSDFEKFLGETSKSLEEQIEEHKEVFERLRDR